MDVIVIGTGPAGVVAAFRAAEPVRPASDRRAAMGTLCSHADLRQRVRYQRPAAVRLAARRPLRREPLHESTGIGHFESGS